MEDRSVKTIAFTLMWCEECTDPYLITTEWKEKKKKKYPSYSQIKFLDIYFLFNIYIYKILFHLKNVLCTNVSVNECGAIMWIRSEWMSEWTSDKEPRNSLKDLFFLY